jgi:hypothetical protein
MPVPVTQLMLAPAERADVVVDFSKQAGARLAVNNHQPPEPKADFDTGLLRRSFCGCPTRRCLCPNHSRLL